MIDNNKKKKGKFIKVINKFNNTLFKLKEFLINTNYVLETNKNIKNYNFDDQLIIIIIIIIIIYFI